MRGMREGWLVRNLVLWFSFKCISTRHTSSIASAIMYLR